MKIESGGTVGAEGGKVRHVNKAKATDPRPRIQK